MEVRIREEDHEQTDSFNKSLKLKWNREKCTGCRACEVACLAAYNEQPLAVSLLFVASSPLRFKNGEIVLCKLCNECKAQEACTSGAFRRSSKGFEIDRYRCTSCLSCVVACPYDVPFYDGSRVVMCNACDGEFSCVKACKGGALRLESLKEENFIGKRCGEDENELEVSRSEMNFVVGEGEVAWEVLRSLKGKNNFLVGRVFPYYCRNISLIVFNYSSFRKAEIASKDEFFKVCNEFIEIKYYSGFEEKILEVLEEKVVRKEGDFEVNIYLTPVFDINGVLFELARKRVYTEPNRRFLIYGTGFRALEFCLLASEKGFEVFWAYPGNFGVKTDQEGLLKRLLFRKGIKVFPWFELVEVKRGFLSNTYRIISKNGEILVGDYFVDFRNLTYTYPSFDVVQFKNALKNYKVNLKFVSFSKQEIFSRRFEDWWIFEKDYKVIVRYPYKVSFNN